MIRFIKENHGLMTAADLAAFRPIWAEPLHTTYHGYDVYSSPATSRGGFELEMALNLVEPYDLGKMKPGSPEALHLLIEAIKVTKADVYRYDADPKFTDIPVEGMLAKSYADSRRKLIEPNKAMVYPGWGDPRKFKSSAPVVLLQPPAEGLNSPATTIRMATPPVSPSWINMATPYRALPRWARGSAMAWSSEIPVCF
jgi:gamma-glutamyltranspeptidase/glutathione hydrolase